MTWAEAIQVVVKARDFFAGGDSPQDSSMELELTQVKEYLDSLEPLWTVESILNLFMGKSTR